MHDADIIKADGPAATAQPSGDTTPPTETELKFIASDAVLKALAQSAFFPDTRPLRAKRMVSTYFDTPAGDLSRQRMSLRIRKQGATLRQTLKWENGKTISPFQRGEIETPTTAQTPDLSLLGEDMARHLRRRVQESDLGPAFITDVRRATRRLTWGGSEIEVAFDTGTITAGDRKIPLREVELELKSGEALDLFQFGLAIAGSFPVRLSMRPKSDRGAALATGLKPAVVRAQHPDVTGLTVDEAIGAIIDTCISQFIANWPAFEDGEMVESIHQMRVALRRLRSALALFSRAFPCPEFITLRAEAKRIASAMGEARNWDVFTWHLRDGPVAAFAEEPGFEALLAAAAERRHAGYAQVRSLLEDPATTRFVLSAQVFVARRGWRNALTPADLARLTEPASVFAATALHWLHRRVLKRGRHLLELPPPARHEVRIALKNLRYGTEFFGDLFAVAGMTRSYKRQCADLQEVLGLYHDKVTIAGLAALLPTHDVASARALGLVLGWYGHAIRTEDTGLKKAWKAFRNTKPFWPEQDKPAKSPKDETPQG